MDKTYDLGDIIVKITGEDSWVYDLTPKDQTWKELCVDFLYDFERLLEADKACKAYEDRLHIKQLYFEKMVSDIIEFKHSADSIKLSFFSKDAKQMKVEEMRSRFWIKISDAIQDFIALCPKKSYKDIFYDEEEGGWDYALRFMKKHDITTNQMIDYGFIVEKRINEKPKINHLINENGEFAYMSISEDMIIEGDDDDLPY